MYKRRRTDGSLSGGTGDVNPQYLNAFVLESGSDTTTTTQIPLPIQRLPQGGPGRAQVMEVLKVWWDMPTAFAAGEADQSFLALLSTKSFGTTAGQSTDSTIISFWRWVKGITTSGTFQHQFPVVCDLTDGAGHGILVASDNLFLQASSSGMGALQVNLKIQYRMKNVSMAEYVGIVQSQQ